MPCRAFVHTSAALNKVLTHKAEEPIARLIAALFLGDVEGAQGVDHPGAVMPLLMQIMLGASRQQFPHWYPEERCVLLQCLVVLL